MIIHKIDPRDIEWEEQQPTYRVYFWSSTSEERSCVEYQVEEADSVSDILAWANDMCKNDATLQFILYVVSPQGPGLVRLAGECFP